MSKLPEKEPFIANAIIRTLRIWRKRNRPAPMIVTSEDIDHLADWAADLYETYLKTEKFFEEHGFPLKKIPTQIKRRGYV